MATFKLEIISPDKNFFNEDVEMAIIRTSEGDTGIMANHINYVASLDVGVVKIKKDGKFKEATLSAGFIKFFDNKATIITEAAEWPHEIDIERAKKAKELAEKMMAKDVSYKKELQKAENRIRLAKKKD